jgi:hypothetical protein
MKLLLTCLIIGATVFQSNLHSADPKIILPEKKIDVMYQNGQTTTPEKIQVTINISHTLKDVVSIITDMKKCDEGSLYLRYDNSDWLLSDSNLEELAYRCASPFIFKTKTRSL